MADTKATGAPQAFKEGAYRNYKPVLSLACKDWDGGIAQQTAPLLGSASVDTHSLALKFAELKDKAKEAGIGITCDNEKGKVLLRLDLSGDTNIQQLAQRVADAPKYRTARAYDIKIANQAVDAAKELVNLRFRQLMVDLKFDEPLGVLQQLSKNSGERSYGMEFLVIEHLPLLVPQTTPAIEKVGAAAPAITSKK